MDLPTTMPDSVAADLPTQIDSEDVLDELLTRPGEALIDSVRTIASPLLILGAGGKMGPTLAVLAARAARAAGVPLEVIAVSRFSDARAREWLEARGVRTVSCDLLDPAEVGRLPDCANLIHLVGLKFGTTRHAPATWAANTIVPLRVCDRWPDARVVALSTGNVYPPSPVSGAGSAEEDPLTPVGEYPNAAVARERILEFHSARRAAPVALIRLFYAVELRYGVLADIGRKVFRGEPVPLDNARVNCIWQGDANDMILRALSLADSPATAWNLCLPESFAVREIAEAFGREFHRPPSFSGSEGGTALLGDSRRLCARLGRPRVPVDRMLRWLAHWIRIGGRSLDRPTHFQTRDGRY